MKTTPAYDEIIEFLAGGPTSEEIATFTVSKETKIRVADMIAREKIKRLKWTEKTELDTFMEFEHMMRLVKARARKHVSHE